PVLHRLVPKRWNIGAEARAAAIWALGLIHEKNAPAELVDALIGRVSDESVTDPEDLRVKRMAAVALGRMKAADAASSVKKYYYGKLTTDLFVNACGWAAKEITGEK